MAADILPSARVEARGGRLPLGRWLLTTVVVGWFAALILVPALALVDPRGLHADPVEPGLQEQPLILRLLQGSGDAPHPKLHAAPHGSRHFPPDHYIRHGKPPTRSENAECFAQDPTFVGREVDHAVRNDHVHRRIRQRDLLDLALQEFHVRDPRLTLVFARQREHLVGHVETIDLSGRPDAPGG